MNVLPASVSHTYLIIVNHFTNKLAYSLFTAEYQSMSLMRRTSHRLVTPYITGTHLERSKGTFQSLHSRQPLAKRRQNHCLENHCFLSSEVEC